MRPRRKPVMFARWWQDLDLLLHERGYALSRILVAKDYYERGYSVRYAFTNIDKRRAEWAR